MMSTWILVVIMFGGGYYQKSPAIGMQEFNSKESCMAAARYLQTRTVRELSRVTFSCVEK